MNNPVIEENTVINIVEKFIDIQSKLAVLNSSDRMFVGEMLICAFSKVGVLDRGCSRHNDAFLHYDIQAGPLGINIQASNSSLCNIETLDTDLSVDWLDRILKSAR